MKPTKSIQTAQTTLHRTRASIAPDSSAGFNLVELLVIVAMIGLLAGVVPPIAAQHREIGRRGVCVSNLHQFGVAHTIYADDNAGIVMETPYGDEHKSSREPGAIYLHPFDGGSYFNFQVFSKYLPGVHSNLTGTTSWDVTGAWWCPSMKKWDPELVQQTSAYWKWFNSAYSYYGRVDLWTNEASRPDDLTAQHLQSDRLLMSDVIVDNPRIKPLTWSYAHGRNAGYFTDFSPPGFTGENQLYGDGRVVWKAGREFDLRKMMARNPEVGIVKSGTVEATFY
jgi:hypothetical protein